MVRKFLYTIAILIVLGIAGLFALNIFADKLTEIAMVPSAEFVEQDPLASNAYQDPGMWISRPGKGAPNDPARWQPVERAGEEGGITTAGPTAAPAPSPSPSPSATPEVQATPDVTAPPPFAVFFVHPTSYLERTSWNAPLDDAQSQDRARIFVRGLASPFNQASEIWAPKYRQATFGAFVTREPEGQRAIDMAYRDVDQAFTFFLDSIDPEMPIVLAGHSQGALHVIRLLKDRIAGTPLQQRIAMVYAPGWPISPAHDLPSLGLPACATPNQGGCIASWMSFAEPAEPGSYLDAYRESEGFDGTMRGEEPILCVNPLSGTVNGTAPASANLGTLVPDTSLSNGELVAGAVPARCDPATGLLLVGEPPELGEYVLPGNNYHVYDIPLFWRNLQEDVVRRVGTWTGNRS